MNVCIGLLIVIIFYAALLFVLYNYYIIVCTYDSYGKLFVSLLLNEHYKSISISWEMCIERKPIILIVVNYGRLCSQDHYALIGVSYRQKLLNFYYLLFHD